MNPGRNLGILFFVQAVQGCQAPAYVILGGLAGALLAGDRALATLPLSVVVLFSMFAAPAASLLMGRYGRRVGFLLGTAAGALGGLLAARALVVGSFGLLLAGSACTGISMGVAGMLRFAAADAVPEERKANAIAWVLAAGLVSALLGPELVSWFGGAWSAAPYAGAYLAVAGVNGIAAVALVFLRIPPPARIAPDASRRRPLPVVLRQPLMIAAIACGMISFAVMSLVMTSTPLAMSDHGFSAEHAADVVRWHMVAMFAPSFFTGHLIRRYGHPAIIGTGLALLGACAIVALSGVEIHRFYLALIVLGLGWNFGFVGATSLLATQHLPEEQSLVQGLNDFLVLGLVALASFGSGSLLTHFGWPAVQYAALPAVLVAAGILLWSLRHRENKGGQSPFSPEALHPETPLQEKGL